MEVEFRFNGYDDTNKLTGTETTIFRVLNALVVAGHVVEVKEKGMWREVKKPRKAA